MRRTFLLLSAVALLLATCGPDTDEGQDAQPSGGPEETSPMWDFGPTHELLDVDFSEGVGPFSVGKGANGIARHVDGTYQLTDTNDRGPFLTIGKFVRRAGAVGITAELVELTDPGTDPGTHVGPMCLGPGGEGEQMPVGYGFTVRPGGDFVLSRLDPDLTAAFLKEGTDPRIETVERVSIMCVPMNGSVALIGFANGLELVTTEDADGYQSYTAAGLIVSASDEETQVRYTRVSARVPDEEWMP